MKFKVNCLRISLWHSIISVRRGTRCQRLHFFITEKNTLVYKALTDDSLLWGGGLNTNSVLSGSVSTGNGEFGDWSAFSSASPPASTASSAVPDLFSDAPPSTQPLSADLFDLMGPNQSSLNASQSMTFTMCPQSTGFSVSRSQVALEIVVI